MAKKLFTVEIEHDDDAHFDAEALRQTIRGAVLDAIPDIGDIPPAVIVEIGIPVPKVAIEVSGGVADLGAVSGVVDLAIVDFDNLEGASSFDVDNDIDFQRHDGDAFAADEYVAQKRAELLGDADEVIEDSDTPAATR